MGRPGQRSGLRASAPPPPPPLLLPLLALALARLPGACGREVEWYTALVSTVYVDPLTSATVRGAPESGRYGDNSPKQSLRGVLAIPSGPGADRRGCAPDTRYSVPPPGGRAEPWIALVARGRCTFRDKVLRAARSNASAVVIYNEERYGNYTHAMSHPGTGDTLVVMVSYPKGVELWGPVQRGLAVRMTIEVGTRHLQETVSGQAVVFVAVVLVTMMLISLGWLVFYYVQHFRFLAAHYGPPVARGDPGRALGRLRLHTVRGGAAAAADADAGVDVEADNCAVCIENYKADDSVRILPCKHVFHRACIDPWLLDHGTCPMCKLDVIQALGGRGDLEGLRGPGGGAAVVAVPESPEAGGGGGGQGEGSALQGGPGETEETAALLGEETSGPRD